jgi:hypothetical protein
LIPDETTLEIKPAGPANKANQMWKSKNITVTDDGFLVIDKFSVEDRGELSREIEDELFMEITQLRIVISKTTSKWILISEIGLS